jgi:tetratricopeptide (TPR) repeat protein
MRVMGGPVGREEELEALSGFVAGVAEGPASFLLEGEPGIGKTTLWLSAVAVARGRGYCVLGCRPAGAEVQLSFAGLGDLLGDVLEEVLSGLPAPQRRALEVALLLEDSQGPAPDSRAIALAVLGGLRVLARSRPVLLAVDDLQWLDAPTEAALAFALRRLRDEPIGALFAFRSEAGGEGAADLRRVFPDERQARLRVGALSVGAVHRLVRSRLVVALPRPLLLRVHEASGGNPFYALELARALERVGGAVKPGVRLPVPESLQELVRARVTALERPLKELLLVVASLSEPTVSMVEEVTAAGPARSRLEAAVAAGVLELDGDRIFFTHPLLASAVYSEATPGRRRRLHRRLAAVVTDAEARARHLALGVTGRDAEVAAELDRAGRQASARGAPDTAAELFELAIEATPLGQDADLRRRKLEAAEARVSSGAIEEGMRILRSLLEELPAGDERAAVLVSLAMVCVDLEEALELGELARREAICDDAVRARAHFVLSSGWPLCGIDRALEHDRLALRHAEKSGQRRLVVEALARLALHELWAGRSPSGLLERAVALEEPGDGLRAYESPRTPLALWQMYRGRFDDAQTSFEALLAEAAALGDEIAYLGVRADWSMWRCGQGTGARRPLVPPWPTNWRSRSGSNTSVDCPRTGKRLWTPISGMSRTRARQRSSESASREMRRRKTRWQ